MVPTTGRGGDVAEHGDAAPGPQQPNPTPPAKGDDQQATDATRPEHKPFGEAGRSPLGSAGGAGGSATAHLARENLAHATTRSLRVHGDNQYYEGNLFVSQFVGTGSLAVVDGPVPTEELRRLDDVYLETPGYQRMKTVLRERHLLALCGEPGTGRTATALALLSELTDRRVVRLDNDTDLRHVSEEQLRANHGYVLELPSEDVWGHGRPEPEREGGTSRSQPGLVERPTELHLDRFRALLARIGAYGVLVIDSGDLADQVLLGRYGMRHVPPRAEEVLGRHLRLRLRDLPVTAQEEARAHAARPEVREALGLDELRPGEAALFAGHLADRQRGALSDEEFLDACAAFVPAQVREWFAGADRPGTLPAALPALRTAAFRIATAVFNGAAYGVVTEAGERLTWEMALTLDPEQAPGRRLFGTRADLRPALARSVLLDGELDLGESLVPARLIRFQGDGLATAVLHEVWHGYHNTRGPISRWLRSLCDDSTSYAWVWASIAAGVLCSWDWLYGYSEIILPMARLDSPVLRLSAATALAEASREASVRPAVQAVLREWVNSDEDAGALRATAALTHGYGLAAGSVSASLTEIGEVARADEDGELLDLTSYSVTRLLAGPEPETVVDRLGAWLRDGRRTHSDLVLVTALRMLRLKVTYLWGLGDVPHLAPHATWSLLTALATSRPEQAQRLADLVRHALVTARSGEDALDALAAWTRSAAEDEAQLAAACRLLPLVIVDDRDRDRLGHLLTRLVRDPDRPLDQGAARRMWDAVERGRNR
ncbi:hypothetical protein AQ490_19880 [Wenjunlia vitaminophila]|uniref:AAA+ ATPase domain-containing protein n=1 Tax=Wenjunlia vitaminophila TaxID=76728 RepID=A0A0T6LU66_WENVI|nr:hypothetical protein AQ490_19880 [Wenjunlia vitaminophila]